MDLLFGAVNRRLPTFRYMSYPETGFAITDPECWPPAWPVRCSVTYLNRSCPKYIATIGTWTALDSCTIVLRWSRCIAHMCWLR